MIHLLKQKSEDNFSLVKDLCSRHMPTLDGIRGLAILFVVFHAVATKGVESSDSLFVKIAVLISNTGWVGVELFFVLSGFLITGILLDGKGKEHQLRNFYARRSLRIFPLYYFTLVVFFILLPLIDMVPEWLETTRQYEIWYWTYMINWIQPFDNSIMIGHFWSLAIEEQFYLLWPLIVISVTQRKLLYICLGLIVSAIGFRYALVQLLPENGLSAAYTFTIARYDALAFGALVAIVCRNREWYSYLNSIAVPAAVFIILACFVSLLVNHAFKPVAGVMGVFNQTLIAALFSLIIFKSIVPNSERSSFSYKALSNPLFTQAGKYSYAIYIFHVPVKLVWFSGYSLDPMAYDGHMRLIPMFYNFICVLAVSTLFAIVSWKLIEQPCLRYKRHFSSANSS